jgi:hypothetical protein
MTSPRAAVVRLSSPADLIAMVAPLLGFVPEQSVVVGCLHGARGRVGLVMRFDLDDAADTAGFAALVDRRVRTEAADAAVVVVFSAEPVTADGLPHAAVVTAMVERLAAPVVAALLTSTDRWWSYLCADPCCGKAAGVPLESAGAGRTAITAAYALAGHGVLPDRVSVVRSLALELPVEIAAAVREQIAGRVAHHAGISRSARCAAVGVLVDRLTERLADPRATISLDDAAELAALCTDVAVRDEVLVRAAQAGSRERLLPVLRAVARRVPAPFDPPVCSMLAWVAYADGDGVVANVALERAMASDPGYSLARLLADALAYQVPPRLLEDVMRGVARDARRRSTAG